MANPVRLQVILHRNPNLQEGGRNTSPNDDAAYFAQDFLDTQQVYDDPAEDSDITRRNLPGMGIRTFHKTDENFDERKRQIQERIRRQRRALGVMKAKHREKWPDAKIYDSDTEEWEYIEELDPLVRTGKQMIAAQRAVEAGVAAMEAELERLTEVNAVASAAAREVALRAAADAYDQ